MCNWHKQGKYTEVQEGPHLPGACPYSVSGSKGMEKGQRCLVRPTFNLDWECFYQPLTE